MHSTRWRSTNKSELIIEVWESLDCESVGARELEDIQKELGARFGVGAVDSPAAIARLLADEGAVLRHPEVFDFDLKWREEFLGQNILSEELTFTSFVAALKSFERLETARLEIEKLQDPKQMEQLHRIARKERERILESAQSRIVKKEQRDMAEEFAQWLAVWLRTPQLFQNWLTLRHRSPEFKQKFQS